MDEFELIDHYFRPLARGFAGALNLRDDAALVTPPSGMQCVITTDMLQESVHFFGHEKASYIAKKALRANLSDLASKGAAPHCYFLTIGLDDTVDEAWIADFAAGLAEDQAHYDVSLAGGDTTHSKGMISIAIMAIGFVPEGKMVRRSGAKSGDHLYVAGPIGDAALGLALLKGEFPAMPETLRQLAIDRYYLPQPKTHLVNALQQHAHAAMDISDGIFQDAGHMLDASHVGADILRDAIPISKAMQWVKSEEPARFLSLLAGGDDYEILCSAPSMLGDDWTMIGHITEESGLRVKDAAGNIIPTPQGYQHYLGRVVGP